MTALREFKKVKNNQINIKLPVDFNYEEVEVVVIPKTKEDIELWSEEEIEHIGKLGMHSALFEDDDEDYAKW